MTKTSLFIATLTYILACGTAGSIGQSNDSRLSRCPSSSANLILTQTDIIALPKDLPPRALRWLGDHAWIVDAGTGAIKRVSREGSTIRVGNAGEFGVLGLGAERMLTVKGHEVFASSTDGTRIRPLDVQSERTITAVVGTGRAIWLAVMDKNSASVVRIAMTRDELRGGNRIRIDVAGPVRLHRSIGGHILAAMVQYPYTIYVINFEGTIVRRMAPRGELNLDHRDPMNSIFALAAVPLDCGRVLQFLTDLRSDRRWAVVYGADNSVLRTRRLRQPIGIIQSLYPDRTILVGFRDSPERGEIVLFRWKWDSVNHQSGEIP